MKNFETGGIDMIKIIAGLKGSGKTKKIISQANDSLASAKGNVVFIEKSNQLMYDLDKDIRLVDASEYDLQNYDRFIGFIKGLNAGNYDITHIFIDGLFKIVRTDDPSSFENFITELEGFADKTGIDFYISASLDPKKLTTSAKFLCE